MLSISSSIYKDQSVGILKIINWIFNLKKNKSIYVRNNFVKQLKIYKCTYFDMVSKIKAISLGVAAVTPMMISNISCSASGARILLGLDVVAKSTIMDRAQNGGFLINATSSAQPSIVIDSSKWLSVSMSISIVKPWVLKELL